MMEAEQQQLVTGSCDNGGRAGRGTGVGAGMGEGCSDHSNFQLPVVDSRRYCAWPVIS